MPQISADRVLATWHATGTGTNAGVSVTKSGVSGQRHVVNHIACSGDAAAVVTIESPAGTVLWQKRFAAAFNHSESLPDEVYIAAEGADIKVKISASTTHSEANIAGYTRE